MEALLVGDTDPIRCARSAWDACVASLYTAPIAAQASEPSTPDLTSTVINDACWKFIEAMPHSLPGPIFNELKPALYAAVCHVLTNTAPQPSAEAVRNSERYLWLRDQTSTDEIAIVMKNKCINDLISYAENIDSYIDRALKSAPPQPAEQPSASPVYDKSVVKRLATQMGWTPPGASPAALTERDIETMQDVATELSAYLELYPTTHGLSALCLKFRDLIARAQGEQA